MEKDELTSSIMGRNSLAGWKRTAFVSWWGVERCATDEKKEVFLREKEKKKEKKTKDSVIYIDYSAYL